MKHNTSFIQFKPAKPTDSKLLSKTAFKSKRIWKYTDELMSLWTNELTITASYVEKNKVFKIIGNTNYIGFFSLVLKDKFIEIDHFWLLPEYTRKGYGEKVLDFIKETAKKINYKTLVVYSDPNANGFYEKMGGKIIRREESKISGRFLNAYEFKI